MNIWATLRILLWLMFGVVLLLTKVVIETPWSHIPLEAALFFVIGFLLPFFSCALNSFLESVTQNVVKWKHPSLGANPFKGRRPVQLWWTGAIALLTAGLAGLVSSSWHGAESLKFSCLMAAGGGGGLLGVHSALRVFRGRFEDIVATSPVTPES